MLKRIKIRGKLLLLLVTPILAVLVFAATGVLDRLDNRDFQERETRIADLADAGSDLQLAIQIQRIRGVGAASGIDTDQAGAEVATSAAIEQWLDAAASARGDIDDPDLIAQLDDLTESLATLASSDDLAAGTLSNTLSLASQRIETLSPELIDQPAELDLFRALANQRQLARIQDAIAKITTNGASSIERGIVPPVTAALIDAADTQIAIGLDAFVSSADDEYVDAILGLQGSGVLPDGRTSTVSEIGFVIDTTTDSTAALEEWLAIGEERLTSVDGLSDAILEEATAAADAAATTANDQATSFLILAGSVVLLALVLAIVVGRSVSRPLTKLTQTAQQLSSEELPALVESMRSGGHTETPELTPIEVKGRDEIATLAGAISEIQQVTVEVAEEQGELLRRGISDIFVNLARRNQSLLDRQIDFIDQLEAREENPDQLENLFRLDHLATRMRRNAESLLVLAGAEPSRRRGRPVELADVVRVAMGEIEDYSRIRLHTIDPGTVSGSVAVDLAHLLSELMENATQFSPPETGVEVVGHHAGDGSYRLTLSDKGIGMSTEAITTANVTLAEPPLVGLDLSRSLGFTVVSRLSHRLGVSVQLESSAQGGVTATVTVPGDMVGEPEPERPAAPERPTAETPMAIPEFDDGTMPAPPAAPPAPIATPDAEVAQFPMATGPQPTDAGAHAPLPRRQRGAAVAPESTPIPRPAAAESTPMPPPGGPAAEPPLTAAGADMFEAFSAAPPMPAPPTNPDADMFAPLDAPGALPRRVPTTPTAPLAPTADTTPPVPVADTPRPAPTDKPGPFAPVHEATVAAPTPTPPLPTRSAAEVAGVDASVTEAGLVRRTPRHVDVPDESMFSASPTNAATTAPTRSPEEVRQMLSRYRSGLRKGRGPGDDAAGGTDTTTSSPAEGETP